MSDKVLTNQTIIDAVNIAKTATSKYCGRCQNSGYIVIIEGGRQNEELFCTEMPKVSEMKKL